MRHWLHDWVIVPCGLVSWPRWLQRLYWFAYLWRNVYEGPGPIPARTAWAVAIIVSSKPPQQ